MPTSRHIAVGLVTAGLLGGVLTGVLSAQTGPATVASAQAASATPLGAAPAPADQGNLFAQGLAAYRAGETNLAIDLWEEAAAAGDLSAQWNLVRVFAGAGGLSPDPTRRLHYLTMAASQHDPDMPPGPRSAITVEALVELARLYWTGDPQANLEPAPARAFRMLEHSATLFGHPRAQHFIGLMYLRGEGVKRDVARAVRWLFLAARKRYAPSQAALGDFFWERGANAEDRLRGLMWFGLATENAEGDARQRFVDRYEQAISEVGDDERKKVDALITSWNERHLAQATQ